MAAHAYLKNEFTEDKQCQNLVSWLNDKKFSSVQTYSNTWNCIHYEDINLKTLHLGLNSAVFSILNLKVARNRKIPDLYLREQ